MSSQRRVSVNAVTAYLDAGYTFKPAKSGTAWPAPLFMCTIWPSMLFFCMTLIASRVAMHKASTFVSRIVFHFSVSPSIRSVFRTRPALLIKMWTGPTFSVVQMKAFRISSSLVRSAFTAYSFPFSFASFSDSESILSLRRAKPTTIRPVFTKCSAILAPIPALAPVTMATLPIQRSSEGTIAISGPKCTANRRAGWEYLVKLDKIGVNYMDWSCFDSMKQHSFLINNSNLFICVNTRNSEITIFLYV